MTDQKELEGFVKLAARDSFINTFEELSIIKIKAKYLQKKLKQRKEDTKCQKNKDQ